MNLLSNAATEHVVLQRYKSREKIIDLCILFNIETEREDETF
jgi:hypothetical protein